MAAYNGPTRPDNVGLIQINAMHGIHHNASGSYYSTPSYGGYGGYGAGRAYEGCSPYGSYGQYGW